jgi:hypothetical protein
VISALISALIDAALAKRPSTPNLFFHLSLLGSSCDLVDDPTVELRFNREGGRLNTENSVFKLNHFRVF